MARTVCALVSCALRQAARTSASMKSKSKKGATSRPNFGTLLAFGKCMARATPCQRSTINTYPFMPHITEELWSVLGLGKDSIQFAPPPERTSLEDVDLTPKRRLVRDIYDTVQAGRNLRTEAKLLSNRKLRFILCTNKKSIATE